MTCYLIEMLVVDLYKQPVEKEIPGIVVRNIDDSDPEVGIVQLADIPTPSPGIYWSS